MLLPTLEVPHVIIMMNLAHRGNKYHKNTHTQTHLLGLGKDTLVLVRAGGYMWGKEHAHTHADW